MDSVTEFFSSLGDWATVGIIVTVLLVLHFTGLIDYILEPLFVVVYLFGLGVMFLIKKVTGKLAPYWPWKKATDATAPENTQDQPAQSTTPRRRGK